LIINSLTMVCNVSSHRSANVSSSKADLHKLIEYPKKSMLTSFSYDTRLLVEISLMANTKEYSSTGRSRSSMSRSKK